jgi:hypothetical protein
LPVAVACFAMFLVQSAVPKVALQVKQGPKPPSGMAAAAAAAGGAGGLGAAAGAAAASNAQYEAIIKSRPEFAGLGKLFKSCAPVRWGRLGHPGDQYSLSMLTVQ